MVTINPMFCIYFSHSRWVGVGGVWENSYEGESVNIQTYLVLLCGTPGALPICLQASRELRGPCSNNVFLPVGALRAS